MFSQDAKRFIVKLIRIQRTLERKGFVRNDQPKVRESMIHLQKYLDYYRYTDDQMKGFIARNRERIRILIPHRHYPGFKKLIEEYQNLCSLT